jgi:hypothetical protein
MNSNYSAFWRTLRRCSSGVTGFLAVEITSGMYLSLESGAGTAMAHDRPATTLSAA